ncbi:shikimate dehydrogenase [Shewanella sp. AS1]|uniref:shikimate dehydrogenase n=1 Tax=Shewanella sp. AS1 TaxID=2907626 RepID=UPI001F205180|nr:shikimate dehydrogenase [Shewanella sp. AS1]MCE9680555.1 shikimate dehydrogenase [Shewanella sp. AS1]
MTPTSLTDRYAVFGNPIGHSKSPFIHQAFANATGEVLTYEAILAPLDGFEQSLRDFFAQGGKGANVTVPFKEEAYRLCDELSDEAKLAGAVNTLILMAGGKIRGENTDGLGLVADLKRHLGTLVGKRVLLLGAGGAARGSILPLLNSGIESLTLHNRTHEKALALVDIFSDYGTVDAKKSDELDDAYDIVINSTSSSLSAKVPELPVTIIGPETLCYDMMYVKGLTSFNAWAQQAGAKLTLDGLGMLVGQAAKSFALWRGVEPDVETVLNALRSDMAEQAG